MTATRVVGKEESKGGKGDGNSNKLAGNKEGDGEGGKSSGKGNKDGEQASGTMAMATATTRVMAMVMRWRVTKRAMARVARAIATTMRIAGDEEGNCKGGKSNGDGNEGGAQQRG